MLLIEGSLRPKFREALQGKPTVDNHEPTKVTESVACPLCGEHEADWLLWQDDQKVECQMCGTQFETA
jgi:DNA-directed RNA polymerase subunit M/transcription elongation factor TFIIS